MHSDVKRTIPWSGRIPLPWQSREKDIHEARVAHFERTIGSDTVHLTVRNAKPEEERYFGVSGAIEHKPELREKVERAKERLRKVNEFFDKAPDDREFWRMED